MSVSEIYSSVVSSNTSNTWDSVPLELWDNICSFLPQWEAYRPLCKNWQAVKEIRAEGVIKSIQRQLRCDFIFKAEGYCFVKTSLSGDFVLNRSGKRIPTNNVQKLYYLLAAITNLYIQDSETTFQHSKRLLTMPLVTRLFPNGLQLLYDNTKELGYQYNLRLWGHATFDNTLRILVNRLRRDDTEEHFVLNRLRRNHTEESHLNTFFQALHTSDISEDQFKKLSNFRFDMLSDNDCDRVIKLAIQNNDWVMITRILSSDREISPHTSDAIANAVPAEEPQIAFPILERLVERGAISVTTWENNIRPYWIRMAENAHIRLPQMEECSDRKTSGRWCTIS